MCVSKFETKTFVGQDFKFDFYIGVMKFKCETHICVTSLFYDANSHIEICPTSINRWILTITFLILISCHLVLVIMYFVAWLVVLKLLVYFWIHIPNKEGKCSGFIFDFKALKNTNDVS